MKFDHKSIDKFEGSFLKEIDVQPRPYEVREDREGRSLFTFSIITWAIGVLGVLKTLFFDERLVAKKTEDHPSQKPQDTPRTKSNKQELETVLKAELTETAGQTEDAPLIELTEQGEGTNKHPLSKSKVSLNDDQLVTLPTDKEEIGFQNKALGGGGSRSPVEGREADNVVPFPLRHNGMSMVDNGNANGGSRSTSQEMSAEEDDDIIDERSEDEEFFENATRDPVNRQPIVNAPLTLAPLFVNQSVIFSDVSLLSEASDPDDDALMVRNLTTSSGTIAQTGNGNWAYTPPQDQSGPVTLTYEIFDGEDFFLQTAHFELIEEAPEIFTGTEEQDLIVGTGRRDNITALGGDDSVLALEGNDEVDAGEGDDTIFGGAGNDLIHAGPGNDQIFGEDGHDEIYGDLGNDEIHGGPGNDQLFGQEGDDQIFGGVGDEGGFGAGIDDLGNDLLDGGAGVDFLKSDAGNNVFIGGADNDQAFGGIGDDLFTALLNDGDDIYEGGAGTDTYDIS